MAMNRGLLPSTIFVLSDFAMDIGQLMPKQSSIIISKMLIIVFPVLLSVWYRQRMNLEPTVTKLILLDIKVVNKVFVLSPQLDGRNSG